MICTLHKDTTDVSEEHYAAQPIAAECIFPYAGMIPQQNLSMELQSLRELLHTLYTR